MVYCRLGMALRGPLKGIRVAWQTTPWWNSNIIYSIGFFLRAMRVLSSEPLSFVSITAPTMREFILTEFK